MKYFRDEFSQGYHHPAASRSTRRVLPSSREEKAMTIDPKQPSTPGSRPGRLTIDGTARSRPKGTLIIRAAELIGIEIPRFCDHPLLDPVGACRSAWSPRSAGQPKPQPSCAMPVAEGMGAHPAPPRSPTRRRRGSWSSC
jgi:hypothetical protein